MNPANRPTLLLVDDLPANLGVLVDFLGEAGYRVLVATSGERALEQLARVRPDLILLDLNMPGLDGYETCRRLKADERWRAIPVLMLTALNEVTDKVRGFAAGAVDFITKPLEPDEVFARVRTHLQIRSLQLALEEKNTLLREVSGLLQHSLDRAVVIAQRDGNLAFCTRRACALLDRHFPGQTTADHLPEAVVRGVAQNPDAPWRLSAGNGSGCLEIRRVREAGQSEDDLLMLLFEENAAPAVAHLPREPAPPRIDQPRGRSAVLDHLRQDDLRNRRNPRHQPRHGQKTGANDAGKTRRGNAPGRGVARDGSPRPARVRAGGR